MDNPLIFSIFWSDRSLTDSLVIKKYLLKNFTQKEIDNFYMMLEAFEKIVLLFQMLYPISAKNKKVYRAVLSNTTICFSYNIEK